MCNDMHPMIVNIMYIQNETIPDYDTRQRYDLHVAMGHSDLCSNGFHCTYISI